MKTVKIKHAYRAGGNLSLQNPLAPVGDNGSVKTWAVVGIPDEVPMAKVVKVFSECCTYFTDKTGRFSFAWSELGSGVLLR